MPTTSQAVLHVLQRQYFRAVSGISVALTVYIVQVHILSHVVNIMGYVFVIYTCRSLFTISACLDSIQYIAKDATRNDTAHQFCTIL